MSNDEWSPMRGGISVVEEPPDEINGEGVELIKDADLVPGDFMCWELDR